MRITFDKMADAIYIRLVHRKIVETKELDANTFVDYDKNGNVVGIELLEASRRVSLKELSKVVSVERLK